MGRDYGAERIRRFGSLEAFHAYWDREHLKRLQKAWREATFNAVAEFMAANQLVTIDIANTWAKHDGDEDKFRQELDAAFERMRPTSPEPAPDSTHDIAVDTNTHPTDESLTGQI